MTNGDINSRIAELIYKRSINTISNDEFSELESWLNESPDNQSFFRELNRTGTIRQMMTNFGKENHGKIWQEINNKIEFAENSKVIPITRIRRYFAVTAALFVLAISGWLLFNYTQKTDSSTVTVNSKNDILPGTTKAILTLSDGSTIILDEKANGTLARQGHTTIHKKNGKLIYDATADHLQRKIETRSSFNKVTTPRGGIYQIILPDNSKVWLNAESSIRFPTTFSGNERRVEITGEAYFEVARNEKNPFKVAIIPHTGIGDTGEVKVLGTHFNINAYHNEPIIKVTLIEGKVQVSPKNATTTSGISYTLRPGQQAQFAKGGTIKIIPDVDIEAALAWKNDAFRFDGTTIPEIMRQLERWYDVEIHFKGKFPDYNFVGSISRYNNISQVLYVMELTGSVHFEIEGRKVIVMPVHAE